MYVIDLGEYSGMVGPDGPERLQAVTEGDLEGMEKLIRKALLGTSKTMIGRMKVALIRGTGKVASEPIEERFDIKFDVRVRVTKAKSKTPAEKKLVRKAKRCTQS
jgi:hypothetical protein